MYVNAFVIDGNGTWVERGALRVLDGRITDVGPTAVLERTRSEDESIVDMAGRTVLPGLIDAHVHLGGDHLSAAAAMLDAGITTARVCGTGHYGDIALRGRIEDGEPGCKILACGRGITSPGGHYHQYSLEADGVDGMRSAVAQHIDRGVDAIKLMLSPSMAGPRDIHEAQFDAEELKDAVEAAHAAGLPVVSHATGRGGIKAGISAGVDSIDHGFFLTEENAMEMQQRGTYLVPTLSPGHYYVTQGKADPARIERARELMPVHREAFKTALSYGVPIAMGCDCGAASGMPNGANALELELMVSCGMPAMDAISTGTRESAKLTRRDAEIGTLERGKRADFIAVDGNPLDDIRLLQHAVCAVVKGGAVHRAFWLT